PASTLVASGRFLPAGVPDLPRVSLFSMKFRCKSPKLRRTTRLILAGSVALLIGARTASAANQTWDGGSIVDGLWSTLANWLGDSAAPGDTSSTTNSDVATFNTAIANTWGNTVGNPIVIDANRNIFGINFSDAVGSYFIGATGGEVLKVSSGG